VRNELQIQLGDRFVGRIILLPGDDSFFAFDESYIRDRERPVLSQYYRQADGGLRQEKEVTHTQLPPWFSNLLPEGALRDFIARQNDIHKVREFQLLALLGEDLPGAVRAIPAGEEYAGVEAPPAAWKNESNRLRFSLAGVQLKFSASLAQKDRMTIPASGLGGSWIVKLPSPLYPAVPENEVAMLTLAGRVGIPVPEHRLVSLKSILGLPDVGNFEGTHALAVKRFDRKDDGGRIHMEDLAQVFGIFPQDKYKNAGSASIAGLIGQVLGPAAAQDFVARLAFIVLTGNGDMHLKNWSLLYPDGRTPVLAPAYDLVSTVPYIPNEGLALNIMGKKDFTSITRDLFRRFAGKAGLPEHVTLETVDRMIDAVQSHWPQVRRESNLPSTIADKLDEHLRNLPLA
jgi:serine/threonine-protein kinase HipA